MTFLQKMKVYITRKIPQKAIGFLNKKNLSVSFYKKDQPVPRKELLKNVKNADAVLSLLTVAALSGKKPITPVRK